MNKRTTLFTSIGIVLAFALGFFMSTNHAKANDDISAYFVWNCNGSFCSHKFNDLTGEVDGEYHVNMINAQTVTNDSDTTKVINVAALAADNNQYAWLTEKGMTEFANAGYTASWSASAKTHVDALVEAARQAAGTEPFDDWEYEHSLIYDPMGARNSVNSIHTNANREFRATIFDPLVYEALQFGTNASDYQYFLSTWDPLFFDSTVDISGSTMQNPAIYESYLLEPHLKFRLGDFSDTSIASIRAVNVNNDGAVSISSNNGEYTITFNSNFHQKVLFEITGENGKTYYLQVNRTTGDPYENFHDVIDGRASTLKLGYRLKYDAGNSYGDYEVRAIVGYADGTSKIKIASPTSFTDWDDEQGGWVTKIEWSAGKNLKATAFAIDAEEGITSLDFTITKKDAFSLIDAYGGTFTGAGKGIHFDDRLLEDILNRDIISIGGEPAP